MTRRLAEERAVGDAKAPKFDGVVFVRSLKKADCAREGGGTNSCSFANEGALSCNAVERE